MNRAERRAQAKTGKRIKQKSSVDSVLAAGIACHRAGDLVAAERHYRKVLQLQPKHCDAIHLMGVIALNNGRAADAVTIIRRSIACNPNFAEAYNNLGLALESAGENDDAEDAYRSAISLRDTFADPHTNLGNLLLRKGAHDAAIGHYQRSLRLSPGDADCHFNLGNAYMSLGRIDEAVGAYQGALSQQPGHLPALRNLAHNLSLKAKQTEQRRDKRACWRELEMRARTAIDLDNGVAEAWYHLGIALRHLEDSAAAAALRACLDRDSDDRMGAAFVLAELGIGDLPIRHSPAYVERVYAEKSYIGSPGAAQRGYHGHRLILDAVAPILAQKDTLRVLDAGCGAGRLGVAIRDRVDLLDGCDVSQTLIDRAAATGVYDNLDSADLEDYLRKHRQEYDLVILAAVLVHYNDLSSITSLLHESLAADGRLVFSTFKLADEAPATVGTTAYNFFAHREDYLRNILEKRSFKVSRIATDIHEYHGRTPQYCNIVVADKI